MKKSIFLILILGELILTGSSPWGKREIIDPSNKDVFISGNLSFKKENLPAIRFWIEGDAGYYSVIIYGEENAQVVKSASIVAEAFKDNVSDSINYYVFKYKGTNYSIIDFDNKKTNGLRSFKLIPLGIRTIKRIEDETKGRVSNIRIIW